MPNLLLRRRFACCVSLPAPPPASCSMTGAFLIWQSRAEQAPGLPAAPRAAGRRAPSMLRARRRCRRPRRAPKSREEKRFSPRRQEQGREDRGRGILGRAPQGVRQARHQRQRRAVVRGMGGQDDRQVQGRRQGPQSGWLTAAEYATTAPPPPKHKTCSCGAELRSRGRATAMTIRIPPRRQMGRGTMRSMVEG